MKEITQQELKALLNYDPETGFFVWKKGTGRSGKDCAGHIDRGYLSICVNGKSYKAQRLAFLYVYGEMPKLIDHINGVSTDNRIDNLRVCDYSENICNSFCVRGESKYKGVTFNKKSEKWIAAITKNHKRYFIGEFRNEIAAANAYKVAAEYHHGEFAKTELSKAQKALKMWIL